MAKITQLDGLNRIISSMADLADKVKQNKDNITNPFLGIVDILESEVADNSAITTKIEAKYATPSKGNIVELRATISGEVQFALAIYDGSKWDIDNDFSITSTLSSGISKTDADKLYATLRPVITLTDTTTNSELNTQIDKIVAIDAKNLNVKVFIGGYVALGTQSGSVNIVFSASAGKYLLVGTITETGLMQTDFIGANERKALYKVIIDASGSATGKPVISVEEINPKIDDTTIQALITKINGI